MSVPQRPHSSRVVEVIRLDLPYDDKAVHCWVYEIWDTYNRLAYVGIAENWERRWKQHQAKSWWLDEITVQRIYLNGYRTRGEAVETEAEVIATQNPVYNTRQERHAYDRALRNPNRHDGDRLTPIGKRYFKQVAA